MVESPAAKRAKTVSPSDSSWEVKLNYQEPPPPGKRVGRYIDQPAKDDVVDENIPKGVVMHNGRLCSPLASLETMGFDLRSHPTKVNDFSHDAEVEFVYYGEMMELIKAASGADRVLIFDHTVRTSGSSSLNTAKGGTAAPVPRVHCDYTHEGAPLRLKQLANSRIYSRLRNRVLTEKDIDDLASRRFAFINVWRNIVDTPVQRMPLAVCDARSVSKEDMFLYELIFPERVGTNYSLRWNEAQQWYHYPRMAKDECLIFKVYDKKEDGPRFVFHTAFEDACTTAESPARQSIEIRAIAFFDGEQFDSMHSEIGTKENAHE